MKITSALKEFSVFGFHTPTSDKKSVCFQNGHVESIQFDGKQDVQRDRCQRPGSLGVERVYHTIFRDFDYLPKLRWYRDRAMPEGQSVHLSALRLDYGVVSYLRSRGHGAQTPVALAPLIVDQLREEVKKGIDGQGKEEARVSLEVESMFVQVMATAQNRQGRCLATVTASPNVDSDQCNFVV